MHILTVVFANQLNAISSTCEGRGGREGREVEGRLRNGALIPDPSSIPNPEPVEFSVGLSEGPSVGL